MNKKNGAVERRHERETSVGGRRGRRLFRPAGVAVPARPTGRTRRPDGRRGRPPLAATGAAPPAVRLRPDASAARASPEDDPAVEPLVRHGRRLLLR